MRNTTVFIILLVAAIFLVFIGFFEKDTMSTSQLAERGDRVFLQYQVDSVAVIELNKSDEKIVLQRIKTLAQHGQDSWQISSDKGTFPADPAQMNALIHAFDYVLNGRVIDGDEKTNENYGLNKPKITGSFTIGSKTTRFKLGGEAAGNMVYLAVDGMDKHFFAVESDFYDSLNLSTSDLRQKKLFENELKKATAVSIKGTPENLDLSRGDDLKWRINLNDQKLFADSRQVEELLRALKNTRAATFVEDNVDKNALRKWGLEKPQIKIQLQLPGEQQISLSLAGPCRDGNTIHATIEDSGSVVCISKQLLTTLKRPALRFIDLRPIPVNSKRIVAVTIADRQHSVTMQKQTFWKPGEGNSKLDQHAVEHLLEAMTMPGSKLDTSAIGTPSFIKASVKLDDQTNQSFELRTAAGPDGSKLMIRRLGEQALIEVSKELWDLLRPDLLFFRERTIKRGHDHDINELKIEGAFAQTLVKRGEKWVMTSPMEIAADAAAARTLLKMVTKIKAKRFDAHETIAAHGLHKPAGVVIAKMGDKKIVLKIGAKTSRDRYAKTDDDEAVFVVGPEYMNLISRPLITRDVFKIESAKVTKIVLSSKNKKREFIRKANSWRTNDETDLDAQKLSRALIDLAASKTIRTQSTGKAGFTNTELFIEMFDNDNKTIEQIEIGPQSNQIQERGRLARVKGIDATFVIPERIVLEFESFI